MAEPKELERGDACPNCGGEFRAARVLSDEEFARIFDKENPQPVPSGADTARPRDRAALGELQRCRECGYVTRFPVEADEPAASGSEASGRGAASWRRSAARA